MCSRRVGAADAVLGKWSFLGLGISEPMTALLTSAPPTDNGCEWVNWGSTELADESCSSSERPQLNPSEHLLPKYQRGTLSCRSFANMFLPKHVFPSLADIQCVSSVSYFIGDVWVWEDFICRTHWTLLDVSLKATSALMYWSGAARRSRHALPTQGIMGHTTRPQQPPWQAGRQLTVTVKA